MGDYFRLYTLNISVPCPASYVRSGCTYRILVNDPGESSSLAFASTCSSVTSPSPPFCRRSQWTPFNPHGGPGSLRSLYMGNSRQVRRPSVLSNDAILVAQFLRMVGWRAQRNCSNTLISKRIDTRKERKRWREYGIIVNQIKFTPNFIFPA